MIELTSIDTINVTGRGEIHVVTNPGLDHPGHLLGQTILLDGKEVTVRGVESDYPARQVIGLIVKETEENE